MKYMMRFVESQVFQFDRYKKDFFDYVDCVKKGEDPAEALLDKFIYKMITNQPSLKWEDLGPLLTKAGYMSIGDDAKSKWKELEEKWRKTVEQPFFKCYYDSGKLYVLSQETASGWAQKYYNPSLRKRSEEKVTGCYYITIEKNRENIKRFFVSLSDLDRRFIRLSDQKRQPLEWKIFKDTLTGFINHNDSLKAYYHSDSMRDDVERTVNEWCAKNGIKICPRTHSRGVDVKGLSFGQLLADAINSEVSEVISKNGDKFTNEQYFEWFKKWIYNKLKGASSSKFPAIG